MFHHIPEKIQRRMQELEQLDSRDRLNGTERKLRLRQIPPETGRYLAFMAASAPDGNFIEIGTSAAYSSMWISLAMKDRGTKLVTFEINPEKISLARETIRKTETEEYIESIRGDARAYLGGYKEIAFAFLDAEKEIYEDCYELIVPNLVPGGILIADNVISHRETLQSFVDHAIADRRMDALTVPIGKGLLLCRKPSL